MFVKQVWSLRCPATVCAPGKPGRPNPVHWSAALGRTRRLSSRSRTSPETGPVDRVPRRGSGKAP